MYCSALALLASAAGKSRQKILAASQQKLDWSQWERVFEMLKKTDAEVKQRCTG
jgi:hypothetical protein